MQFQQFSFGQIRIDGIQYGYDVVINRGKIRKRKKKPSKRFRDRFGHTPLSLEEEIPWKCRRLVIGTGNGALPVMDEVRREAERRKVELIILPTDEAMKLLNRRAESTNAILHVTC
ncbi:MAG: MTH938/NDUFAF3 family protein [Candidatus Korobacteraceae bacterium]